MYLCFFHEKVQCDSEGILFHHHICVQDPARLIWSLVRNHVPMVQSSELGLGFRF